MHWPKKTRRYLQQSSKFWFHPDKNTKIQKYKMAANTQSRFIKQKSLQRYTTYFLCVLQHNNLCYGDASPLTCDMMETMVIRISDKKKIANYHC